MVLRELKFIKPNFFPWVGAQYWSGYAVCGGKMKLLLVGESHNQVSTAGRDKGKIFTQESIRNLIDPTLNPIIGKPASYWTKAERIVAGKDNADHRSFWDSVAFYNYLQKFYTPPNHPSGHEYEECKDAFLEVLENVKPDAVIILCKRLWYYVKDIPLVRERGLCVNHPSRASYGQWNPIVESHLKGILGKIVLD